ncbi:MAG: D-alanyl-D-alanine carboxypeptidase [Ruminococcus sp.]|nr:D-alanyl-D-alanine carboxypeptidase [Ruminococcus sp.]
MNKRKKLRFDRVLLVIVIIVIAVLLLKKCGKDSSPTDTESVQAVVTTAADVVSTTVTTTVVTTTTQPAVLPLVEEPYHRSAAVFSADRGEFLYSENLNVKTAPASLTKLLTAATAIKYGDLNSVYTVGSEQALVSSNSSMAYIQAGDSLTLKDLITGMLMASGNDAAYTIAVSVGRDVSGAGLTDYEAVEAFCGLMNNTAKEIGMNDSCFTTPDGWDNDGQYTTAADLIVLADWVMEIPEIRQIVGTYQASISSYGGVPYTWTNSNLLLDPTSGYYRENVIGIKTGTTYYAGNSLLAAFTSGGETLISVVTGCETDYDRYELTIELMDLCSSAPVQQILPENSSAEPSLQEATQETVPQEDPLGESSQEEVQPTTYKNPLLN